METTKTMMTSSNGNIFRVTGHLCGEIHRWPVNSPHKRQWRGALMFNSICAWINSWVHNREAGNLRPTILIGRNSHHKCTHYITRKCEWLNTVSQFSTEIHFNTLTLVSLTPMTSALGTKLRCPDVRWLWRDIITYFSIEWTKINLLCMNITIMWLCIRNYLAWIHDYFERIHKYITCM